MKKHTFAICAYKESPYLEECIESLKRQTIPSDIIVVTSTPSEYIQNIAEKYKLPYYINKGEKGITQDSLINDYHVNESQLHRLRKNMVIKTTTLDRFCEILDCEVGDICQYTKDDPEEV